MRRRLLNEPTFFETHGLIQAIDRSSPVILDIGAYDGGEIEEMLACWKTAQIYAFEIDRRAINLFKKRYKKEIRAERVKLVEAAISDTNDRVPFYSSEKRFDTKYGYGTDWAMSGSIRMPKKHLDRWPITFSKPMMVNSVRLDDWCSANIPGITIDLIYADVNGGERELIQGGLDTLQNRTRFFYTEFFDEEIYEGQPGKEWILSALPNFRLTKIVGHNMLLENMALS